MMGKTQIYGVVYPISLCTKTTMGTQTPVGGYSFKMALIDTSDPKSDG